MATDENNHKNEARDDWTGCTFRVERGPSSEGRAWGMADILTDVLSVSQKLQLWEDVVVMITTPS